MSKQDFDGRTTVFGDAPTPEQTAILGYLDLSFDAATSRAQAAALIAQAESDPASRERFQAWHRDKYRLHPDLFTPPQRSAREARWWQARVADEPLFNRYFRPPSPDQVLAVLESLDRQESGWEREAKNRRETRFLSELATFSPELRKSGCPYPQALPAESFVPAPEALPAALSAPVVPPRALSVPFVPGSVSAPFVPPMLPSKPAWTPDAPQTLSVPVPPPPLPPPGVTQRAAPASRRGGRAKWPLWLLLLAGIYAVGAAAYAWWHRPAPETLTRTDAPAPAATAPSGTDANPKPAGPYAPAPAQESRLRAVATHPDLGRAGSPLNAKFVAAYRILLSQHSPRLLQSDWPERLADEFDGPAAPAPAAPKAAASMSVPATSKAPAAPKASPAAQRTAATAPAAPPAASLPRTAAAASTASAGGPPPPPSGPLFVTLDAVNKTRANNYSYSWSPYYYADYDVSFRQTVGIEAKVRNMTPRSATVVLRWMFFGRKTSNNERYVFSAAQKRLELAPGQTTSDVLDSPMIQSKAAVYYTYGMHYFSGSKYEGWLVQVLPENSDQVLRQVGSSDYVEDFGKRPDLTTMLKEQLSR